MNIARETGKVNGRIFLLLAPVILMQCFVSVVLAGEIDATTVVSRIIDGDTFDTTSEGRVRLADVDCPEYGEDGYNEAKSFLISLISGKTVYLDIDDVYETDKYGRLICVVYVKHNSTHYKNVNKALLVGECTVIKNYYNEFNPYTWALYVHKEEIPEVPSFLILLLFMMATLLAAIVYRRKHTCESIPSKLNNVLWNKED